MILALVLTLSTAQVPPSWSCDPAFYADGICDCGCTAADSDCGSANFKACARSGCSGGDVPWEHQNSSCMESTCGDGWKADDEACDDGNALASGGCGAGCASVNPGYVCGERAEGCMLAPVVDAGTSDAGMDAGTDAGADSGIPDAGVEADAGPSAVDAGPTGGGDDPKSGGCASVPGGMGVGLIALLGGLRRRRGATAVLQAREAPGGPASLHS